jgi:hypothetical protein
VGAYGLDAVGAVAGGDGLKSGLAEDRFEEMTDVRIVLEDDCDSAFPR